MMKKQSVQKNTIVRPTTYNPSKQNIIHVGRNIEYQVILSKLSYWTPKSIAYNTQQILKINSIYYNERLANSIQKSNKTYTRRLVVSAERYVKMIHQRTCTNGVYSSNRLFGFSKTVEKMKINKKSIPKQQYSTMLNR